MRCIAYHGTAIENLPSILNDGLLARGGGKCKKKTRARYGEGIYLSPDIQLAAGYGTEVVFDNVSFMLLLMVRVKPGSFKKPGMTGAMTGPKTG